MSQLLRDVLDKTVKGRRERIEAWHRAERASGTAAQNQSGVVAASDLQQRSVLETSAIQLPANQQVPRNPQQPEALQIPATQQSPGIQQASGACHALEPRQTGTPQQTSGSLYANQSQPREKEFRFIAAGKGGKFPLMDQSSFVQAIGSTDPRDHIGIYCQIDLWTVFVASIIVPRWERDRQPSETRTEFCDSIRYAVCKRLSEKVGVFQAQNFTQTILAPECRSTLRIFCDDIRELGNDAAITGIFHWAGIYNDLHRNLSQILMAKFIKETPGDSENSNFHRFIICPSSENWSPVEPVEAENVWTIER